MVSIILPPMVEKGFNWSAEIRGVLHGPSGPLNSDTPDRLDFATPPSSRLSEKLSTRPSIFFHLSSVRQQGSFLVVRFLVSLELSSQSALALAPNATAFAFECLWPTRRCHCFRRAARRRCYRLPRACCCSTLADSDLTRSAINSRANPRCTHGFWLPFFQDFWLYKRAHQIWKYQFRNWVINSVFVIAIKAAREL